LSDRFIHAQNLEASMRKEKISVPLPAELLAFVEARAKEEAGSVAGVIRRLVAEAARKESRPQEAA
jgi:hypothetical protein